MLPIILFDTNDCHENLLPLSFTRPIAEFRVGITTIADKWARLSGCKVYYHTLPYLSRKYPCYDSVEEAIFVAGNIIPTPQLVDMIMALPKNSALMNGDTQVACRANMNEWKDGDFERIELSIPINEIKYVFDVFLQNGEALVDDFYHLTQGRESQPLSDTNTVIGNRIDSQGRSMFFIEEGASVEGVFINLKEGPIYIGKNAQVKEGSCLRGPIAVCDNAQVNMGAKIYGNTTIGPWCKVGGEVNNIVMFGYSNKSHDGFLGNAVIGEWCNIGAGVNASNLKNDYSKIRIWNYATRSFMRTNLQFCGLIMGDHSKVGINVMLNTATVMGVGVNLHGAGFPRTFIPSFSEGSPSAGFSEVTLKKFHDIASRVMSRRGLSLTDSDKDIFDFVRTTAASFRH